MLALAACSPKLYRGEHVAKASVQENSVDSSAVSIGRESSAVENVSSSVDTDSWTTQITVTEKFSAPDSTGRQFMTERTTTAATKHDTSSSKLAQEKSTDNREHIDSTVVSSHSQDIEQEEETKIESKARRGVPWYVYAIVLAVGFGAGIAIGVKIKWLV